MRKLASIQRIKSLEPISGADSIEMARVLANKIAETNFLQERHELL